MHTHGIKSRLRTVLALTAMAGLTLAASGRNLNADHAATRDSGETYATAAVYGWTSGYARLAVDQDKPNNDVALLIKVKTALVGAPDLKPFALEVGVLGGVVTLYGEVDTAEHRAMAERIARAVKGVAAVNSGIAVLQRV